MAFRLLPFRFARRQRREEEELRVDDNQHPKGALLFMLLYLLTLTGLWLNAYLRLWGAWP